MNLKLVERLKEKLKQKFPNCNFRLTDNLLTTLNVQLPIIPKEINLIINEVAQPFSMRLGQVGWIQRNYSIIILYNP